ncbi:MAG: 6-phosphogluconolactonase [Candidatus Nanopelagicales bacterium]|nr:6-phosphogluconolactonase [Candidatus Nanopelagicales bacterium]
MHFVKAVEIIRHQSSQSLADAAAAQLITTIVEAQTSGVRPHIVLTGGGIGTAVLASIASSSGLNAVDWYALEIWWGDERYLPAGDPERNETSARAALLDLVPIPVPNVHAIAGPDTSVDAQSSAASYATELARFRRPMDHAPVPSFEVVLLGIGPDGHVASLFPEQPALHDHRVVTAVQGAPKPPPNRITMTLPTICAAREVWVLASGIEKAAAVRLALDPAAGVLQVPAAGVRGRARTLFLIDEQAASKLPPSLGRITA